MGVALREQGLYDEAEQEFRIAIKVEPRCAAAHAGLGILRDLRGDEGDQAVEDLRRAVALDPRVPAYFNNLGFALYLRDRLTEAVVAYRGGLRLDPGEHRIRNNLGFVYARLGHLHRAKREFEHAGPPAAVANNLGVAAEQARDLDAACDSYRRALALDAELAPARVNRDRLCAAGHAAEGDGNGGRP